jgi:hypothetical protein
MAGALLALGIDRTLPFGTGPGAGTAIDARRGTTGAGRIAPAGTAGTRRGTTGARQSGIRQIAASAAVLEASLEGSGADIEASRSARRRLRIRFDAPRTREEHHDRYKRGLNGNASADKKTK